MLASARTVREFRLSFHLACCVYHMLCFSELVPWYFTSACPYTVFKMPSALVVLVGHGCFEDVTLGIFILDIYTKVLFPVACKRGKYCSISCTTDGTTYSPVCESKVYTSKCTKSHLTEGNHQIPTHVYLHTHTHRGRPERKSMEV